MKKILLCFFCAAWIATNAYADDAISDQVYGGTAAPPTFKPRTDLSTADRLAVLERQVNNLNQQNASQPIQDLQTQIADLKGRIETLTHQYQQLSDQMKQQYQDVDQRLQNLTQPPATPKETPATKNAQQASQLEANEKALENLSTPPPKNDDAVAEQKNYEKAFNYLKAKDQVRAVPAFQNFLSKYPNGLFAPNAHFWLGEIYLLQGQPDMAATEYRKVVNDFPQSDKVQMAQLKLAFAYRDQGNKAKARVQFQKVIKLYPKSTTAKLAAQQLDQLT